MATVLLLHSFRFVCLITTLPIAYVKHDAIAQVQPYVYSISSIRVQRKTFEWRADKRSQFGMVVRFNEQASARA